MDCELRGDRSPYPLVNPAEESVGVRAQLLTVIEDMPEILLEEVKDFAEFVRERKMRVS